MYKTKAFHQTYNGENAGFLCKNQRVMSSKSNMNC